MREVIVYLILLDAVLLICGIYLNEAANFGISKYIPPQFSKIARIDGMFITLHLRNILKESTN